MLLDALFAFLVAGFGLVLYLVWRILLLIREREEAARPGPGTAPGLQEGVEAMIAELQKTAAQINRDLIARSARLQQQIEEAERKIAVLEEAVRLAEQSVAAAGGPLGGSAAARPADGPGATPADPRPLDARDPGKYQQIRRLADEGLSSLDIARRTQLGREEVELVLGLREGKLS
jgi:hypothetical protein